MTSPNREWLVLGAIVLTGLLSGILTGDVAVAAAVGVGLYALRQAWTLHRLARTLRGKRRVRPPFPGGAWRDVFATLSRLQRRSRARKRRLKRFVSRFRDAAAAVPDVVVILGDGDRVEWFNPAAGRLLALDAATCLGRRVTAAVREPVFADYLRAGDFGRPLEMPAPGDRGVMLSLLVTLFGPRRQRLLLARDITRSYHLDRSRRDFIANVSHELRTPLTVLSGNLEMLDEAGVGGESARPALQSMRENVSRMQSLVEDLLALSRLEMDRDAGAGEGVDVPALLVSVLRDAKVLAADTRHELVLEAEQDLWLRGSAGELRSAFGNLVHNAVRHTPPRTAVAVRWYADEGGASLAVSDRGPGIPERHLPRLTERFYRVDPGRSTATGGTGLGLAIVKHVLERHDATLGVRSREGAGTTFECHFPPARVQRIPADAGSAADATGDAVPG